MPKVKISAKREISYNLTIDVTDEDYETIKHLELDDVYKSDYKKYSILEEHLNSKGYMQEAFEDVEIEKV